MAVSFSAKAAIPTTLGYQGRLKNSSGSLLTGTYNFTFRIYATTTGGAALWSETQNSISVDTGAFAVQLGSVTAFPTSLDFNQPLFMTLEVNTDGEMSPRVPINTVAYSYTAGGVNSLASAPGASTGGRMYYNTANGTLNYYDATAGQWRTLTASSTGGVNTLQQITTAGNTTTNAIQFAGGTSTGAFTASSDFTVSGSTNLQNVTFTNSTGTSLKLTNLADLSNVLFVNSTGTNLYLLGSLVVPTATITNLNSSNAVLTGGSLNGTPIGATTPSTAIFTNATSTGWLGFVTASGTTVNALAINSASVVSPSVTLSGGSINNANIGLSTPAAAIFTNVTSTGWMGFVTASGTTLNASSATLNSLVSGNVTITGGSLNNTPIGSTTPATGIFTNATSTGWLGFGTASGTTVNALTSALANLIAGSATATTMTISNGTITSLSGSNELFINSTSTGWLGFNLAKGNAVTSTSLYVTGLASLPANTTINGVTVCLSNSTNCPAGTGTPSLQQVTNVGNATTNTIQFAGGTSTNNFVVTGNLTATGTTSLANTTITNATTTGYFGFVTASGTTVNALTINANSLVSPSVTISGGSINNANIGLTTPAIAVFTNVTSTGWMGFVTASGTTINASSVTLNTLVSGNATATTLYVTGLARLPSDTTINSKNICLTDGTNCPAGTGTPTLQQVTNMGSITTSTLQFAGGTSTNNLVVTGNLNVTGTTNLANTTMANATTTGYFGFVTASGTTVNALSINAAGFVSPSITVTGGTINNTSIGISTPAIAVFTNVTSTGWLGFVTASGTTINASGATLNALATGNATATNLFVTSIAQLPAGATVNSKNICLADGTNCPAGTGTPTLQQVTNMGSITTSTLQFAGGTSTNNFMITGNLNVTGTTNLANTTMANATTTGYFGFVTASGTTVYALTINATSLVSPSVTITGGSINNANIGLTTPAIAVFTNATSTGWLGFVTASGTTVNATNATLNNLVSGNVTITGGTLNNTAIGATTPSSANFTNVSATNVTSTGFFGFVTASGTTVNALSINSAGFISPSVTVTGGTINNTSIGLTTPAIAVFTNVTSTGWLGFVTASGTTLNASSATLNNLVSGNVTITGGSLNNTPLGSTTPSTGVFTNATSTGWLGFGTASGTTVNAINGSIANLIAGNATATTMTISNGTITSLTGNNEVFVNVTSTGWLGFNLAQGTTVTSTNLYVTGLASLPANTTINGVTVCLSNNTNCPSGVGIPSLQQVTAVGNSTTSTIQFAGGTSTNNFVVSGDFSTTGTTSLQGLTFTNATGTNVTTTNLFASGSVSSSFGYFSNSLMVQGKNVCLADGTNCQPSLVKTSSSKTSITLTAAEKSVINVTTTPSNVTNQIWIIAMTQVKAESNTDRDVVAKIRRGAACAGGTLVGVVSTSTLVTTLEAHTIGLSFVDSPATTTATGYQLCLSNTAAAASTVQGSSITVEEVKFGADLGEVYYSRDNTLSAGEVLSLDSSMTDGVARSASIYDQKVIGVVSTQPGLLLSNPPVAGGSPVIVALVGRVPVKVTAANGAIVPGDYLTTSNIPGVAMKATKAGPVIGQALSNFEGEGVGQVMLFIKNGSFNGQQTVTAAETVSTTANKELLTRLVTDLPSVQVSSTSQVFLDRLIASVDVVAPSVTAQNITADSLQVLNQNLTIGLGEQGKMIINGTTSSASITSSTGGIVFDSFGNGMFSGKLTAKEIQADTITGMQVYTDKIASMSQTLDNLSRQQEFVTMSELQVQRGLLVTSTSTFNGLALFQGGLTVGGEAMFQNPVLFNSDISIGGEMVVAGTVKANTIKAGVIESPTIADLTSSTTWLVQQTAAASSSIADVRGLVWPLKEFFDGLDLSNASGTKMLKLGSLELSKGLKVAGLTTLSGGLEVDRINSIGDLLTIGNDTLYIGRPYFNTDTGGFAVIRKGTRSVEVKFDRDYISQPVVSAMISLETEEMSASSTEETLNGFFSENLQTLIMNKSVHGFTLRLNKLASQDLRFSWIALAVKDARTIWSPVPYEQGVIEPPEAAATSTAELPPIVETPTATSSEEQPPAVVSPVAEPPAVEPPAEIQPTSTEPVTEPAPVETPPVTTSTAQ